MKVYQSAMATLTVAVIILSFLSWQAAQNAESAAEDAAVAAEAAAQARTRAECITERTGPFFAHVSSALVELNDDGNLSAATAAALRADAEALVNVNAECSP